MSTILGLAQRLLAQAQNHRHLGRTQSAMRLLRSALRQELPAKLAEDARVLLAELYQELGDFLRARRHLQAALALAPHRADLHHRLAILLETDETTGDHSRALRHYARAVKLAPHQAACRRDYGLALIAAGKPRAGLNQLQAAFDLDPDDLENLRALALHLVELDRAAAARKLVKTAAFRFGGSPAYQQVQRLVGFAIARREQEVMRQAVSLTLEEPPVILPFLCPVRMTPTQAEEESVILRFDGPSTSAPHVPRPARFRHRQTN